MGLQKFTYKFCIILSNTIRHVRMHRRNQSILHGKICLSIFLLSSDPMEDFRWSLLFLLFFFYLSFLRQTCFSYTCSVSISIQENTQTGTWFCCLKRNRDNFLCPEVVLSGHRKDGWKKKKQRQFQFFVTSGHPTLGSIFYTSPWELVCW